MMKSKTLLLFFIAPLFAFTTHKYYLSLTQIEYNAKNKSVEIIINVFTDDLETTFNKTLDKRIQLDPEKEPKDSEIYFSEYLKKHINFKIDGKAVSYNYIGKEYDGDVIFFYLEIKNVEKVENIEVNNSLLLEYFPDQQNLIKSKVGKKYKSVLLTKKEQKAILKF